MLRKQGPPQTFFSIKLLPFETCLTVPAVINYVLFEAIEISPPQKCHLVFGSRGKHCAMDCTVYTNNYTVTSPYMLISESIGPFNPCIYIYEFMYILFQGFFSKND